MFELKDKKVIGLRVSECSTVLEFQIEGDKSVIYRVEGDCCSHSWFADIVGVEALLGQLVREVEEVQMESRGYDVNDGRALQEVDQAYGYKLKTAKGFVDLIFRNSSNGYYGGEIYRVEELPAMEFYAIVDDWMADGGWDAGRARAQLDQRAVERAALKTDKRASNKSL